MKYIESYGYLTVAAIAFALMAVFSFVPAFAYAETVDCGELSASATEPENDLEISPTAVSAESTADVIPDDKTSGSESIGGGANATEGVLVSSSAVESRNNTLKAASVVSDAGQGKEGVANAVVQECDASALEAPLATTGEGGASKTLDTAGKDNSRGSQLVAQSADGLEDSLGPLEIAIAKSLVTGAAYGAGMEVAEFGVAKLMPSLFGKFMKDDTQEKLDKILQKLDAIENALNKLSEKETTIQLQNILNDLKLLFGDTTTSTIFNSLKDYDNDLASGKITAKQAEDNRLNALTKSLNITDYSATNTSFDKYVDDLWTAITKPYSVTIGNQPQNLTLTQIYYELMRRTYEWEHQAYDEWAAFDGECVSLLITALTLNNASLDARIKKLGKADTTPLQERKQKIVDRIRQAVGYSGEDGGTKVNYEGLFSEKTWAEQYWLYKERPDYRYYWVPGHEVLFFAQVNTQDVPKEPRGLGLDDPDDLRGINVDWSGGVGATHHYDVDIVYKFWKPFLRYQGGDYPLVSADTLNTIYGDYQDKYPKEDYTLYYIFMDEDKGNFKGLEVGDIVHWYFVIDQDKGHKVHYKKHTFKADELYCYVVASKNAKVETATLCKYHYSSHEANNWRHFIGIGVARMGPETYNPGNNGSDLKAQSEIYTAVEHDTALWSPSRGDLTLSYGGDTHGDVSHVYMDDVELDESCYSIVDGKIVLTQAFLTGLGYGAHELFLDTKAGGHSILFSTQVDESEPTQAVYISTQADESEPVQAVSTQLVPRMGDVHGFLIAMLLMAILLSICVAAYARYRIDWIGR